MLRRVLLALAILSVAGSACLHFAAAARPVSLWLHSGARASHAHTADNHQRRHLHQHGDLDQLGEEHRPQPRLHNNAQDALSAEFAVVASTKTESVLLRAKATDLSKGVFYDGAPASAYHNHEGHDHDHHDHHHHSPMKDGTVFEGGLGEVLGAPKDATHHISVHVPDDTVSVRVLRKGKPHGAELPPSRDGFAAEVEQHQRTADTLATRSLNASTIDRRVVQIVDLNTNPTLVILSSGYTANEIGTFFADVDRVMTLLQGGSNAQGVDAGPWARYISLFNVYSIYERSGASGASFRVNEQHQCPSESGGVCAARVVDNNLNCTFGSPYPRVLGCEYQQVAELAALAPKADVVLVIVNALNYGGSGGAGIAVVSKGADMELAVLHQLNHAVAGLGDEYDYGVTATPITSMHNCQPNNNNWQSWITAGLIDNPSSAGCTYANLVRPTRESCLMRNKAPSMCSVCKEGLVRGIYSVMKSSIAASSSSSTSNGTRSTTAPLDLAAPRCPPYGHQLVLSDIDSAELSINHVLLSKGNISTKWTLPTGGSFNNVATLTVLGSQLVAGLNLIKVDIADSNADVSSAQRSSAMSQSFSFEVYKQAGSTRSGCSVQSCKTSRGTTVLYCSTCTLADTAACARSTSGTGGAVASSAIRPTPVIPEASSSMVAAAVATVVIIGCVVLIGGLIAVCCFRRNYVQEVMVIRGWDLALLCVTLFFQLAVFIIAICVVAYGVVSLPKAPIFGESSLLGGLIVAAALCIISAVLIVAAYARSFIGLLIPGIIVCVLSIPMLVLSIISLWVASNPFSETVRGWMRDAWKSKVTASPQTVCDVQNYFQCSGYEQNCAMSPAVEYCPTACTYSNRYTDPCVTRFYSFFTDEMRSAAIAAFVSSFFVIIAGVCSLVLAWRYQTIVTNARHRRSYRHEPRQPVEWITSEEHEELKGEFAKISTDPNAVIAAHGGTTAAGGGQDTSMMSPGSRAAASAGDAGALVVPVEGGHAGTMASMIKMVPTAEAHAAVQFVADAFGEQLDAEDKRAIVDAATAVGNGKDRHISLERIMHIIFPYMDFGNPFHDPRTLTEDEAASRANAAALLKAHQQKHETYIEAAGALPPAKLRQLYMQHCMPEGRYRQHPNFFEIIAAEAKRYGATQDGQMCRGLCAEELDGLRALWARINPAIDGELSDGALSTLFAVTHGGTRIRTQEHFARWKTTLDVRGKGVGWPEFCLPFASRAQVEDARRFLVIRTDGDLDVLAQEYGNLDRLLSRREVAQEFNEGYLPYVFLPGEDAVPLIRVLAAIVRGDTAAADASAAQRANASMVSPQRQQPQQPAPLAIGSRPANS